MWDRRLACHESYFVAEVATLQHSEFWRRFPQLSSTVETSSAIFEARSILANPTTLYCAPFANFIFFSSSRRLRYLCDFRALNPHVLFVFFLHFASELAHAFV